MPNRLTPTAAKQFDARTASIVVQGEPISDLESFGFDQSKDHDLQYTLDQRAIWVKTTPELTGTFVMKATSEKIPVIERAFLRDRPFQITAQLARTSQGERQGQRGIHFVGCMLTDFSMSDYEVGGMPTVTGEWQGVNRGDNRPARQNRAPGQQGIVAGGGGGGGGGGGTI